MPQEIYIILLVTGVLLLYLLYRLKLVSNDLMRIKKGMSKSSVLENLETKKPASLASSGIKQDVTDDSELVAVLTAAIMAYEAENSSGAEKSLPAHGFIIRRVVRI